MFLPADGARGQEHGEPVAGEQLDQEGAAHRRERNNRLLLMNAKVYSEMNPRPTGAPRPPSGAPVRPARCWKRCALKEGSPSRRHLERDRGHATASADHTTRSGSGDVPSGAEVIADGDAGEAGDLRPRLPGPSGRRPAAAGPECWWPLGCATSCLSSPACASGGARTCCTARTATGYEVRDQPLGVLGTGPASVGQALLVRQWSDDVVFFPTPWT